MSERCPNCGSPIPSTPPPEPPVGTWMKDRHGAVTRRHESGGWAPPGCMPSGKWEAMWEARGPFVECAPLGADR